MSAQRLEYEEFGLALTRFNRDRKVISSVCPCRVLLLPGVYPCPFLAGLTLRATTFVEGGVVWVCVWFCRFEEEGLSSTIELVDDVYPYVVDILNYCEISKNINNYFVGHRKWWKKIRGRTMRC